jgi:hypothetical protein
MQALLSVDILNAGVKFEINKQSWSMGTVAKGILIDAI